MRVLIASILSTLTAFVAAQTPVATRAGVLAPVHLPPRPAGLALPALPRAALDRVPRHEPKVIPPGTGAGRPMPDSPEAVLPAEPGPLSGPGDFNLWFSRSMRQPGFAAGWPPEPQALVDHDAVLFTHNTGAALSADTGVSWTLASPQVMFPNSDGGFAGDQRLVRSHAAPNLCFWLIQYSYSASTRVGRHRLVVARGRDDLKAGRYYTYDLLPTDFGFPTGLWLDFPDLACSDGHLYGSANLYRGSDGGFAGAVLWRIPLGELAAGGTINYAYATHAALGDSLYRFTQNATGTMWAASRLNSNTLRLYFWPDNGALAFEDKTTAATSTATVSAPGPDARNWAGSCDHRILGGYVAGGEVGFLYSSAPVPGRPNGFVRVTVFDPGSRAVSYESDIWSTQVTLLYPAASRNAFNHKAVVMTMGGGGFHPSTIVAFDDPDSPGFDGSQFYYLSRGDTGPATDRWGDYLGVTFHPLHPATFVAPAFSLQGGTMPANVDSRFVWFGRERYTPTWVDVDVVAVGLGQPLAAAMTVTQVDRFLAASGTTPLRRSYPPRQALTIAAPGNVGVNGDSYRFVRWVWNGVDQAVGDATLRVADIGVFPGRAEARYERIWRLDVDSQPPGAGITVDVRDVLGRDNGTTPFERAYPPGTRVTLIAPDRVGNAFFSRWVLDNQPQPPAQRTLTLAMDADRRAFAEYGGTLGNGVEWVPLSGRSAQWPARRRDHAMVFERSTGRVLVFGGDTGFDTLDDTWALTGDQWARLAPSRSPSKRRGAAAAFHAVRGETVLFGGGDSLAGRYDDTWCFDGVDWTQRLTPLAPSPRIEAAMTYDWLHGRIVLFGGAGTGSNRFNDTWAFDGSTWTQLTPAASPPALLLPSLTYDAGNGTLLLTGRDLSSSAFQLWGFDGQTWVQVPTNPIVARGTPLVYDPHRDRLMLLSGVVAGTGLAGAETYEWDRRLLVERTTPLSPGARGRHGLVWDEWRVRFVLFGGQTPTGLLDDTWEYTYYCDAVARGHVDRDLAVTCTSLPRLGGTLCLEFASPAGPGALLLGFGGLLQTPLPLGLPILCSAGLVHVLPEVVLPAPGNPARVCVPVPGDPGLAYQVVGVQGVSPTPGTCVYLTRAAVVVLRP